MPRESGLCRYRIHCNRATVETDSLTVAGACASPIIPEHISHSAYECHAVSRFHLDAGGDLQSPCDGVCRGLHSGHEEDAELAPHAREGQRVALPLVQVHQVVAYRGILFQVSPPPAYIDSRATWGKTNIHLSSICIGPVLPQDAQVGQTPCLNLIWQTEPMCWFCRTRPAGATRDHEEASTPALHLLGQAVQHAQKPRLHLLHLPPVRPGLQPSLLRSHTSAWLSVLSLRIRITWPLACSCSSG